MASLLHCPSASELCCPVSMDIPEACPRPHRFLCRRTPPSYRCTWRCVPLVNVVRFSCCVKTRYSLARSPKLSMMKGKSIDTHKGSHEVTWTVEADLAEGQTLYLTGDLDVLGCWEPDLAVLMSPTKHENLWKAEAKIASGANFRYNYFIKEETSTTHDIIWRPGPEFSLLVPPVSEQNKSVVVRDSWIRSDAGKLVTRVWGSLVEETYLPCTFTPFVTDGYEIMKRSEGSSLESEALLANHEVKEKLDSNDEIIGANSHSGSIFSRFYSERDQPVEEPWLPNPTLFSLSNDLLDPDKFKSNETIQYETVADFHENLLPGNGSDLGSAKESVPTIILINSSICTMQRIAVLEDGKLVELLLEPVKSNVQCDNVYLGVISKLVPHMGGAFVNIGNSRHSLMGIKQNREPFVFPPFNSRSKKKVNNFVMGAPRDHFDAQECDHMTQDAVEAVDHLEAGSHNHSVQFMHDEDDEHDAEDDSEVPEVLKDSNGSIVDYGEDEVDFEENGDPSDPDKCHEDKGDDSSNCSRESSWSLVRKGTKIIVQIVKEGLGTKGPTLTAYPKLRSRFWILITRCDRVGVSKKISGVERTRLKVIAKTLQPPGFGLTVRTVAAGHSLEELQKDLEGLLSNWKNIVEHAKSAALAADEGVEGAAPLILHRAMGQTLSVVQDYFNDKVEKMIVDSQRTYHEVTSYLQDIAPDLCDRVELHDKRIPLFDEYNVEEEINGILSKRVTLPNGGSLVIEQTEALVSIDVNGGHGMFGHGNTQEKAILDVNLAAAKQIARELRLRDVGGIIVVDFIDMIDESNKRLVYEEVKKAVERDRSMVKVSELSRHGLMEITRKRVRPSVTFMISEPCTCCHATGRVEALETSFSKIEQEICRLLAAMTQKANPENPKSWPRFVLRVDNHMCNYLTTGKRTRLAILSSSLKVWILLKVARGFSRGEFEVKPFADDKPTKNQHHVSISVLRQTDSKTKNSGKKVTVFPVKKLKATRK